jgi:hypothetical protein
VRLLHDLTKIHATFDDPHLVSQAGLVPAMALARRGGLADLAGEHVRIGRPCGVNAHLKVPCLVAGMIAGADSIVDMGLLRYGALPGLFGGIRAPLFHESRPSNDANLTVRESAPTQHAIGN